MKNKISLLILISIFSCEKEKTFQFKLKDGFNIFCKKYEKHEGFYSISECCVKDDRQRELVKNGIKKEDLKYIIKHPQDW